VLIVWRVGHVVVVVVVVVFVSFARCSWSVSNGAGRWPN